MTPEINTSKPTILIVDDDPGTLMMMCEIMKKEWEVRPVSCGELALEMALTAPPDLILLDVMLPGKSGLEICQSLKANLQTEHVPIILVTTLSAKNDKILGLQAGADDFVSKPIDRIELLVRTRNLLRVKRYADLLKRYNESLAQQVEERTRELQKIQQQLIQQEKMASMGLLMAGIGHEINTPIGFIHSNLRSLRTYTTRLAEYIKLQDSVLCDGAPLSEAETVLRERQRLKIDHIIGDFPSLLDESLEGADRVRQIVSDMKLFSHADTDEFILADINNCLERTLSLVKNELKYKVTVTRDLLTIPQASCLPNQLSQVFLNLLVNAAQAIETQGEITVRTWQEDHRICIAVSDNGCGMSAEIRDRIFDPFFTTKEAGKGTGLGLSISYGIIKKHGGEIAVESEPGKGTTFTVSIPITQAGLGPP